MFESVVERGIVEAKREGCAASLVTFSDNANVLIGGVDQLAMVGRHAQPYYVVKANRIHKQRA